MRHLVPRALAVAACASALVLPFAVTTTTGPAAGFAPERHPLANLAAARHPGPFNVNGYNWGGYAAQGSGFSSVTATWTEPAARCNSRSDLYAPWVGIDGYGSSTVEQTGVATDCSSGSARNQAWYEIYPAAPVYLSTSSYPVSSGDSITASVVYTGGSSYQTKLVDNSRGWTYTHTSSVSARRTSAEVIIESPPGRYPNFGTITFTGATVNGGALASVHPSALDPSNGVYEAHTGALSGGSFSITYQHE